MGQKGTRTAFGSWLSDHKKLTYTAYSKLPIPGKAAVYDEYRKSKRKGEQPHAESQEEKEG